MYLGQGYFLLLVWVVVGAYDELDYNFVEAPLRLELFKTGSINGLNAVPVKRLNTIPVVPRPAVAQRPGGFRRPTTTPRPFRKRPTTSRPQPLPVVRPQPARPQVQLQATTPRPLPATVPPLGPQMPSDTPFETDIIGTPSLPETGQFPIIVPDIHPTSQPQKPIVVASQTPSPVITNEQPAGSLQPPLSVNQQFGPPNQGIPDVLQVPTIPDTSIPQQMPVFSATVEPQRPTVPSVPESPSSVFLETQSPTNVERPPAAPSQSQSEAQPPFEGPNLPPNRPTLPPFSSSQTNTGAGGGRPQKPLAFPVARPPLTSAISRPPFRPRPPGAGKPPSAQPPFDSGPHVPPKPPPVPATSTTSFGVNPAPPDDKPQRPLPPSRPILLNPLPLPKPPYQLTTTEKPSFIFNESSMSDDGNYTFDFLVSNSVYRKEQGFLKKSLVHPGHLIHVKTGAYSFTSPEGTFHRVDFVADEHGYRAYESTY